MRATTQVLLAAMLLSTITAGVTRAENQDHEADALDRALQDIWDAGSGERAGKAAAAATSVLALGPSFEEVLQRLRRGRSYSDKVRTGRRVERAFIAGELHLYSMHVPETYDPQTRYAVRVYLHGGAQRAKPSRQSRWYPEDQVIRDDTISVFPAAWRESLWWQPSQLELLHVILDKLKAEYNIDENRVFLNGFSDGATGTYCHAFFDVTPWAAFLPFCGSAAVLANPRVGMEGVPYVANLTNKPLLIINAGHDRYYPLRIELALVELFRRAGAEVVQRTRLLNGHDLSWLREEEARIEKLYATWRRQPHPARLVWQTDDPQRRGRVHWMVITRLGSVPGEARLDDYNHALDRPVMPVPGFELERKAGPQLRVGRVIEQYPAHAAGVREGDVILAVNGTPVADKEALLAAFSMLPPDQPCSMHLKRGNKELELKLGFADKESQGYQQLFPRPALSGRVELARDGNCITALSSGVTAFTLLLSPAVIDFGQPVEVYTNGVQVFSGRVQPDPEVLLRWAARDNDRTMLYAAELAIEVQGAPSDQSVAQ